MKNIGGGEPLNFCVLSPNGNLVAFVRDNNVFMQTISGDEVQLTSDGINGIVYNGVPDWVYEGCVYYLLSLKRELRFLFSIFSKKQRKCLAVAERYGFHRMEINLQLQVSMTPMSRSSPMFYMKISTSKKNVYDIQRFLSMHKELIESKRFYKTLNHYRRPAV